MNNELFVASADATIANAARLGLMWRLTPATVIEGIETMNTLVTVDVDLNPQPTRVISLIGSLATGQRVMLMIVPPLGTYIIGMYGSNVSLRSYIDEIVRTTAVTGITTTETLLDQITFTSLGPDVRYKLTWVGTIQSSVAGDGMRIRARWNAGVNVDSSGTLFTQREVNADVINKGMVFTLVKTVTGIPAGTASIGVLAVRGSGTGTLQSFADANREISLLLEYA